MASQATEASNETGSGSENVLYIACVSNTKNLTLLRLFILDKWLPYASRTVCAPWRMVFVYFSQATYGSPTI